MGAKGKTQKGPFGTTWYKEIPRKTILYVVNTETNPNKNQIESMVQIMVDYLLSFLSGKIRKTRLSIGLNNFSFIFFCADIINILEVIIFFLHSYSKLLLTLLQ